VFVKHLAKDASINPTKTQVSDDFQQPKSLAIGQFFNNLPSSYSRFKVDALGI
jgi:hypothetical protein